MAIKIAVLGLGNLLLRDDGVGVHAVRMLSRNAPQDVEITEIGTAALNAQRVFIEFDHVIAIDAVHGGGPAGTIYSFDAEDETGDWSVSLHDLGIIGALKLLPEKARPRLHIIGVEPEIIDYGTELSQTVSKALPRLLKTVKNTIDTIRNSHVDND